MTAEEYRQRMIQAFHSADCDELIAVCVLPTEKEFEHLEWLLKNHYKKEPCNDAISRQAAIGIIQNWLKFDGYSCGEKNVMKCTIDELRDLPSVSTEKTGWWIYKTIRGEKVPCCSRCGLDNGSCYEFNFCPECGAKMEVEE